MMTFLIFYEVASVRNLFSFFVRLPFLCAWRRKKMFKKEKDDEEWEMCERIGDSAK